MPGSSRTTRRHPRVILLALTVTALAAPAVAAATPTDGIWPTPAPEGAPYAVRALALPAGATASTTVAVTADGLVAGEATVAGRRHAVLWDAAGRARDLGAPEGGQSWAVDVADNGWVAGTAEDAGGAHWAWVWPGKGAPARLGGFGDRQTEAVAINRSGQVAVQGLEGPQDEWGTPGMSAWVWTPGAGPRRLTGLGGWRDVPMALNDAGQVAGSSAAVGAYPNDLVFWDARGGVTNITGPTGAYVMYPDVADLDESGMVAAVVFAYSPQGDEGDWTVAWDAEHGLRDGSFAWEAIGGDAAVAMNERGQVVAAAQHNSDSDDLCGGDQATLWTVGDQPDYLPVGACYSNARAIDDLGEVAGTDGFASGWVYDGARLHVLPGAAVLDTARVAPPVTALNDAGLVAGMTSVGGAVRATTWAAPGGSATVRLTPSADTYLHRSAPTRSFGSETSLAAGGDADYVGLLRFAVPQPPAGRRLVAARLHLRTSTQSFAASAVAHPLRAVRGAWSESSTWATRPALGAQVHSSVLGATGSDTSVAVRLDPRDVPTGTLDLAVTGAGPDSVWWFSRESAASTRPTLELIYR